MDKSDAVETGRFPRHRQVLGGNPGIQVELSMKHPQGINPKILLLDLRLVLRPGIWPQVMIWTQCRYERIVMPSMAFYTQVKVFNDGRQSITLIDIVVVD